MIGGGEMLDDADREYLATLVPDDAMDPQMMVMVSWMDPDDGEYRFHLYDPFEALLSTKVGLLEMAKLELLRVHHGWDDDDDE